MQVRKVSAKIVLRIILFLVVLAAAITFSHKFAKAGDPEGKYKDAPHHEWFKSATSKAGDNCCNEADGYAQGKKYAIWANGAKIERVMFKEYELKADGYWVTVYNKYTDQYIKIKASEDTFVYNNPTGYPIVWLRDERLIPDHTPEVYVRCFARESEG